MRSELVSSRSTSINSTIVKTQTQLPTVPNPEIKSLQQDGKLCPLSVLLSFISHYRIFRTLGRGMLDLRLDGVESTESTMFRQVFYREGCIWNRAIRIGREYGRLEHGLRMVVARSSWNVINGNAFRWMICIEISI